MYLAVTVQAYDDWSLLDTRIHDINLVTDLTAHDPNDPFPTEPLQLDGSDIGTAEDAVDRFNVEDIFNLAGNYFRTEWNLIDWWPIFYVYLLGLDSNFQPNENQPPLLTISFGFLGEFSIISLALLDFVINAASVDDQVMINIAVDFLKDLLFLDIFGGFMSIAFTNAKLADGLRNGAIGAGVNPALSASLLFAAQCLYAMAFTFQLLAFGILELGYTVAKSLNMDISFRIGYYLFALFALLNAYFGNTGVLGSYCMKFGQIATDYYLQACDKVLHWVNRAKEVGGDYPPIASSGTIIFIIMSISVIILRIAWIISAE